VAALVSTVILLGVALAYRFRGVEPAPTDPPPDQTE
jgi:hypothetical protein